jgi:hypothetical protein
MKTGEHAKIGRYFNAFSLKKAAIHEISESSIEKSAAILKWDGWRVQGFPAQ